MLEFWGYKEVESICSEEGCVLLEVAFFIRNYQDLKLPTDEMEHGVAYLRSYLGGVHADSRNLARLMILPFFWGENVMGIVLK